MVYIAKQVMLTKKIDKEMSGFPVYEDIVICFSDNIDEAREIISNSSIEEAKIVSDGLKIGDDSAKQYFSGSILSFYIKNMIINSKIK